jgi:cell division inhibitor SepF
MPGAMRKLGLYLGLVEDDEDDATGATTARRYLVTTRRRARGRRRAARRLGPPVAAEDRADARTAALHRDGPRSRGAVALDPGLRAAPVPADDPYRITTLHPRTYNEARTIGEHFRDGTPVIMNLTEMDDVDAKRLVDFAGRPHLRPARQHRAHHQQGLPALTEHVEVTAEDKARIAGGGFFNQS